MLRDVNLRIDAGEFVAVMGPSGSGKSTFMNILGCLDVPTRGNLSCSTAAIVAARPRTQLARCATAYRLRVPGVQPAAARQPAWTTWHCRWCTPACAARERAAQARRLLARVGLANHADRHPNQISGGQQQRVAIARALVNAPRLLLADEPTGNLDTATSHEIMGLFTELNAAEGITIVLVTHEADIAPLSPRRWCSFVRRPRSIVRRADVGSSPALSAVSTISMIGNLLREALRAMAANQLRTFLTMLGMVIGVGAVILMLAIGQGAQFVVKQTIATLGSNLFIILSGTTAAAGVRTGGGNAPTLTTADAAALAELHSVAGVAPVHPGSAQLVYGSNNWNTQVNGVTPDYFDVRSWRVERGQPFTDTDMRSLARVALLGQTVVRELFRGDDPIGQTIRIRNSPYLVVGVLTRKGQSFDGRDQDDTVLIPLTTAQRKLFGTSFPGTVRFMLVQGVSEDRWAAPSAR